jgi:hypothetical protein
VHQPPVDVGRLQPAGREQLRHPPHLPQHRRALWVGAELDHLTQRPDEAADQPDPLRQPGSRLTLIIHVNVRHDLLHRRESHPELGARYYQLDRPPHIRHLNRLTGRRGLKQHAHRGGELRRRPREARMLSSALLLGLALRLAQQLGHHQQVKQLKAIVDRARAQMHDSRHQRRQAARRRMPAQSRRLRRHPIPGHIHQPPDRHERPHRRRVDPDTVNLRHPHQRQPEIPPGRVGRSLPPPLKTRCPGALGHLQQQIKDPCLLHARHPDNVAHSRSSVSARARATRRASVVTPGSSTSRSRNQPIASLKIARGPSPVIHARASSHSSKVALDLGELAQPARSLDLFRMIKPRRAPLQVTLQSGEIVENELPGDVLEHHGRDVQRIAKKRAEPADSRQLERETQPVVLSPATGDQRTIGVIQKEDPVQVLARQGTVIATIRRLRIGQELDGHRRTIARPRRSRSDP